MTAPLTARLIAALQETGISAFPEFPPGCRRIPAGCFVTVGIACCDAADAVPADGGFAIPLTVRLRMRAHVPANDDIRSFAAESAEIIIAALAARNWDVREVKCGDVQFLHAVGKLVLETEITVGGVLRCRQEEVQDADDA